MPTTPTLAEDLLAGRRALEARQSIKVVDDWKWEAPLERWGLQVQVEVAGLSKLPARTDWFLLVDAAYPFGEIDVFPSNTEYGITTTLPHQEFNDVLAGLPFRSGKICLSDPIASLGRGAALSEPFTADERLLWHVDRLTEWIKAADSGDLQRKGDHFELPHFPSTGPDALGFNETEDSFQRWQHAKAVHGSASVVMINGMSLAVTEFREFGSNFRYSPDWGTAIDSAEASRAIWLRLPDLPLVKDWQVPTTWGELDNVCNQQGVKLFPVLQSLTRGIRDGKQHLLLIGFPIPTTFGCPPTQLHWQTIRLPLLSNGKSTARGFRANDQGFWRRDLEKSFTAGQKIQWLSSSNWSNRSIRARGGLIGDVADNCVAIVGCGSLGSSIAELLVRLGLRRAVLIDGDNLLTPNLSRHTLSLPDVGENKAKALAGRLNTTNPFAAVTSIPTNLSQAKPLPTELKQADIIIDCSGSDAVLRVLSTNKFDESKAFFSFSMARGATRLYAFCAAGNSFPVDDFHRTTQPTLKAEAEVAAKENLQWESAGCWHPLFPARLDDIWTLAAAATKWIENHMRSSTPLFEILPAQAEIIRAPDMVLG